MPGKGTENKVLIVHVWHRLIVQSGARCSWTVSFLPTAVSVSAVCHLTGIVALATVRDKDSQVSLRKECGDHWYSDQNTSSLYPYQGLLMRVSCSFQCPSRQMGIFNSSFNSMYNSLVSYTPLHLCQPTENKGWDSAQLQSPAHSTTSFISFPSFWFTCLSCQQTQLLAHMGLLKPEQTGHLQLIRTLLHMFGFFLLWLISVLDPESASCGVSRQCWQTS